MSGRRTHHVARLAVAVLVAISATVGLTTLSSAAPSARGRPAGQGTAGRAQPGALPARRGVQPGQAAAPSGPGPARRTSGSRRNRAQAAAEGAEAHLNASAARAYQGVGSQVAVLFESTSLAEFSDRLEFIGSMAQADTDLALEAELARQEARWTAEELAATVEERQGVLAAIDAKAAQIEERVGEARDLYEELDRRVPRSGGGSARGGRGGRGGQPRPSRAASPRDRSRHPRRRTATSRPCSRRRTR